MKKDKSHIELKMEMSRRSHNYAVFDQILKDDFGGDIIDMYTYVYESDDQFKTKFEHDQFLNDFINWMKNRKITLHD
jgi:hypothetical protein